LVDLGAEGLLRSEQRGNSEMANSENLRTWNSGQSGRQRRSPITSVLQIRLAQQSSEDTQETVAEGIAAALIKRALSGDLRAIREVADRCEGRPTQQVRVEAPAGEDELQMDPSRLSDDHLRQLDEIISVAMGKI
jgi:hypothetical protein